MKRLFFVFLVVVLIFVNVSCSSRKASKPVVKIIDTVTATIDSTGGTISAPNTLDAPSVTFPNGALNGTAQVTLNVLSTPPTQPANSDVKVIGHSISLKINGAELANNSNLQLHTNYNPSSKEILTKGILKNGVWFVEELNNSQTNVLQTQSNKITKNNFIVQDTGKEIILSLLSIKRILKLTSEPPMEVYRYEPKSNSWVIDNSATFNFNGSKVALMVHGIFFGNYNDFTNLAQRLSNPSFDQKWNVYSVKYYSGYGIDSLGIKLTSIINQRVPAGKKIDIFAHSMGGLISRSAIEQHDIASKVNNLFTMSSPHSGSSASFLLSMIVNNKSKIDFIPEFDDLTISSPFLTALNQPSGVNCNYFSIVGTINNPPFWNSPMDKIVQICLSQNDGVVETFSSRQDLSQECNQWQFFDLSLNHNDIRQHEKVLNKIDQCLGRNKISTPTITPTPSSTPTPPPTTSKIVFSSNRNGYWNIFITNMNNNETIKLTDIKNENSYNLATSWSPDGTKIVFMSLQYGMYHIYTIKPDGSYTTQLTNDNNSNLYPSWSPDGKKIIFTSFRNGLFDIYIMDSDGSNVSPITNTGNNNYADLSPDGTKIVFVSWRYNGDQIYIMDIDGKNIIQLTNISNNFFPKWSPDGKKIAFISDRNNQSEIYTMNIDGSNLFKLTNNGLNNSPDWSPDGNKIIFSSHGYIYTINSNGGIPILIPNNSGYNENPNWYSF